MIRIMDGTMTDSCIICISHAEDADGLTCAALLKRLKGAIPVLATYDDFKELLKVVEPPVSEVYICDLNVREALVNEILRINEFASVTILDHHPSKKGVLENLIEEGVEVVHSPLDCASVLVYDHFREELGRGPGRLAAYAAWADQFEDGPIATMLLREYDRQLVQYEGLTLAHAIISRPTEEFRRLVIETLSVKEFPHRVPDIMEAAKAQLEYKAGLIESVGEVATMRGNIAFVKAEEGWPIGTVAGLLMDAIGAKVGVCYSEKDNAQINISIRSRRGFSFHLGKITQRIAESVGGFGGGHKRASGASIPQSGLDGFLRDFEESLKGQFD
jgi:hypothetical protein